MKYFSISVCLSAGNMLDYLEQDVDISEELSDTSDLPTAVIITNVDNQVFVDESQKVRLEEIFQQFDQEATFQYFKSFRRVRINFTSSTAAANARIQCHQTKIGDSVVNCYFAQSVPTAGNKDTEAEGYLQPPLPVHQFLISPPASPPVGWEPVDEAQPCINYDLLSALAKLTPGEAHELHPPSKTQPAIVVHVCEDQNPAGPRIKIMQTRHPDTRESTSSSSQTSAATS